jgi:hypothetical protein
LSITFFGELCGRIKIPFSSNELFENNKWLRLNLPKKIRANIQNLIQTLSAKYLLGFAYKVALKWAEKVKIQTLHLFRRAQLPHLTKPLPPYMKTINLPTNLKQHYPTTPTLKK